MEPSSSIYPRPMFCLRNNILATGRSSDRNFCHSNNTMGHVIPKYISSADYDNNNRQNTTDLRLNISPSQGGINIFSDLIRQGNCSPSVHRSSPFERHNYDLNTNLYRHGYQLSATSATDSTRRLGGRSFSIESLLGNSSYSHPNLSNEFVGHNSTMSKFARSNDNDCIKLQQLKLSESQSSVKKDKFTSEYRKRNRTIFTVSQLQQLETEFSQQQYMVGSHRRNLAMILDLTESQVKVWFQNRRIKERKRSCITKSTK